jgi:hypothetical protein
VSWWIQSLAKRFSLCEDEFFRICKRLLSISADSGDETEIDDVVFRAINHPVGHITEALLRWWYRRTLEDNQGLPPEIAALLQRICQGQSLALRHGRVVLAAHVINLFRVDPSWTSQYLLPHFDWRKNKVEAGAVWEGFLWSPRIYAPLLEALKQPFLEAAEHYSALGKHGGQYASLLTFVALAQGETFTTVELRQATQKLPADGLRHTMRTLVRALDGDGKAQETYWQNRVAPYLQSVWPKSLSVGVLGIADSVARLCVAAGSNFPDAFTLLSPALEPLVSADHVVDLLSKSGICSAEPELALDFLDKVISPSAGWSPSSLRECLNQISERLERTSNDGRLRRIDDFLRKHGH